MMKHLPHLLKLLANLEALLIEMLALLKTAKEQHPQRLPSFNCPEKIWLDTQEAKEYLHVSDSTLKRLRNGGELPYARLQGKLYYKLSDIAAMLDRHYSGYASC